MIAQTTFTPAALLRWRSLCELVYYISFSNRMFFPFLIGPSHPFKHDRGRSRLPIELKLYERSKLGNGLDRCQHQWSTWSTGRQGKERPKLLHKFSRSKTTRFSVCLLHSPFLFRGAFVRFFDCSRLAELDFCVELINSTQNLLQGREGKDHPRVRPDRAGWGS